MKRYLSILSALLALVFMLSLASCGSTSLGDAGTSAGNFAAGGAMNKNDVAEDMGMSQEGSAAPSIPNEENRKIIKTYRLSAETQAFDEAVKKLAELVSTGGGYIESSSLSGSSIQSTGQSRRYANYTLRIPAENADAFVGSVGDLLNITQNTSNVEDVSIAYYSIEAKLEELKTERDSLLAMMQSLDNKTDYNFWLTLQSRISSVKQEIAAYESQLKNYDSRVSYSTVHLNLSEVKVYSSTEEDGFLTQLGNAFAEGWDAFTVFLSGLAIGIASSLPFLVILAGIIVGVVFLIKHAKKKKRAKKLDAEQAITNETQETES